MITLSIGNSTCQVSGVNVAQLEALRKLTSYTLDPRQAHFGGFRAQGRRYLMSKRGEFPTGLLYIVKGFLTVHRLEHTTEDNRRTPLQVPESFIMNYGDIKPYPEQLAAVEAALKHSRGIIVAPTGVGKSLVCALMASRFNVRTLIVVPTLELKRQLSQSLLGFLGKHAMRFIKVENVDALDPKVPTNADMVIIDEFHHSGAKTYRELNKKAWAGVYYKFGLTATPFRSQDHERLLLESVLSKVIYRIEHADAVAKGYIVPIEAYYIELPTQKVKSDTWAAVYSELVVNNEYRNKLIAQLLDRFKDSDISALCLVKEIKHGVNVGKEAEHTHAFANGVSEHTREYILEFNLKYRQTLIGTTGVLGEGVDTKPAEYVIIAGLGKSKNAFMQQVGRGFRTFLNKESCKILIFKDSSHKWTLAHYAAQVKILKDEYGVRPIKLDLAIAA